MKKEERMLENSSRNTYFCCLYIINTTSERRIMRKRSMVLPVLLVTVALLSFVLMGFTSSEAGYGIMQKAVNGNNTRTAVLWNSQVMDSGKAYAATEGGRLYHYAEAALQDPPAGMFYEGWLVNAAGDKMSTGILTMNSSGNYEVAFLSDMMMEGYNTIVITLEEMMDDMPETKVLSGMIQ